MEFPMKAVVVGGCGHVGLPLALFLTSKGFVTYSLDKNATSVEKVNSGNMPFFEEGAEPLLLNSLSSGNFKATTDVSVVSEADFIVVVIGTPIDEYQNPDAKAVFATILELRPYLRKGQLLILRSTVFPGTTKNVQRLLDNSNAEVDVIFAPERILEGKAILELQTLPQIVGADSDYALEKGVTFFENLGIATKSTTSEEAEFAKLFTNTWRYIKFAAANQFWMLANEAGLDYSKIRDAITFEYPRAADLPQAGFAAGPCLLKDTLQLAAFSSHNFSLGNAAVQVNEGQPIYLIEKILEDHDLSQMTVGILGMAFKGESDDPRSSLSYKLKRILIFKAKKVMTADPYVKEDSDLFPQEDVVEQSDILIIGSPHHIYKDLITDKPIYDVWNLRKKGNKI